MKAERKNPDKAGENPPANGPETPNPPKQKRTLLDALTSGGEPVLPPAPLPTPVRNELPPRAKRTMEGGSVPRRPRDLLSIFGWLVALGAVAAAVLLWVDPPPALAGLAFGAPAADSSVPSEQAPRPTLTPAPSAEPSVDVDLPEMPGSPEAAAIPRRANPVTIIPSRPRTETIVHVVEQGDAIFSIADAFDIEPETVLWANYDLLNDNPDFLEVGMELNIPPVDGVYYQWQEGDTLASVAAEFEAEIDEILNFSGNRFDLANPVIAEGDWVMLPGGHREFRQWLIPTIARGNAGVNSSALGPGACSGSYTGPVGSGAFIWPASNHTLSGNDYWSGHLGIDIGAVAGDPIFSSDAGVVVFTGWANGGYGYTVVVDHGNGYQTLYAHMSSVSLPCGAGVGAGSVIGSAGSTGNSTGTHLHFEVRLSGGFINPWFVLPPP